MNKDTGKTLEERFKEFCLFHNSNRNVYTSLHTLAKEAKTSGASKCSIELLYNKLRWDSYLETKGESEFKLSNNHKVFYANLLMLLNPDLVGFFDTRSSEEIVPLLVSKLKKKAQ